VVSQPHNDEASGIIKDGETNANNRETTMKNSNIVEEKPLENSPPEHKPLDTRPIYEKTAENLNNIRTGRDNKEEEDRPAEFGGWNREVDQ